MFTKTNVEAYFNGEKSAAILFMVVGTVAIIATVILWVWVKTPLAKGIAVPLVVIGCMQFVVGYTVYSRADKQRTSIVYAMDMNPELILQKEIPRMKAVMKSFVAYRYVEIAILVAGLALWIAFRQADNKIWKGIGIGLMLQASVSLCSDYFAEKRGHTYLTGLERSQKQS